MPGYVEWGVRTIVWLSERSQNVCSRRTHAALKEVRGKCHHHAIIFSVVNVC